MANQIATVAADKLAKCRDLLFNKSRFSGAEIGRLLKRDTASLWTDFHVRGLTAERATKVAKICDDWAAELRECAKKLRSLASEARAQVNAKPDAGRNPPLGHP